MAISTVNVDFSAILQNAAQATGLLRVRLSQVGTVEDSETGNEVILPITWQEMTLTDGAATLALVPNKIIEPSCTYYEIQLKSVPDCPRACAKLLLSGIMYVPDEDCNVLDLLISPPSPETANTASGYASQAKQAAQVAENFAIQAGDRYDDVAEAAATALTDIGTAKQDALDAIGTAQSEATEAISTAEDAALQAIGQARGAALDDIGTAQGTATAAVQAEGNTQVGRVEDAGEDAVADVTAAQATAVSAVQAQQATSVAAVTAEGTRQTGLVTAEGTAQVNAVTQAGNGYIATMQGLVSDAQAARDAAQTAQGLAEDAQAAAESASTDAQGYAGDASTSAGQAAQSASDAATSANDAADSATAAQASAESIAESAEQIQTNERNITNIQALLNGTLYREETDSTAAYSKSVPTGAMPYASVDMIGGRTVVWNQLVDGMNSSSGDGITTSYDSTTHLFKIENDSRTTNYSTGSTRAAVSNTLLIQGHKYIIIGISNNDINGVGVTYSDTQTDFISVNSIVTLDRSNIYFRLRISKDYDFVTTHPIGDVITFYLNIIDLTLLCGAGNEPATVAEFEAMFPSVNPAYNAGELMSAGVAQVVSRGRNIYDGVTYQGYYDNSTGAKTSSPTWLCNDTLMSVDASTTYYLNIVSEIESGSFGDVTLFDARGNFLGKISLTVISRYKNYSIITLPNAAYMGFYWPNSMGEIIFSWSKENSYTPYFSRTLPIPPAIQALPGYGWSAGTVYNYVDYARKVYVQRVGKIVLDGTQTIQNRNFNAGDNGVGWLYPYSLTNNAIVTRNVVGNLVSDKFPAASYESLLAKTEPCVCLFESNTYGIGVWQSDTSLTQLNTINAYLAANPITVYYELATPIETDISQYLSDDNLINVEAGGTLTFKNQHGDDWRVPVPNSETFLVQATPELPTTDGTYTLQCTVTDGTPSVTWVTA